MKYRLVPVPNVPADFPMDSLFDADQDSAYRAINDWGITPRAFFTVEPIPKPVAFYTVAAVAAAVRVNASTVNRWILDGHLRAELIGKRYRIRPADLDAFVHAGRGGRKHSTTEPTEIYEHEFYHV